MESKLIAEVLAVLWLDLLRGILRSMNLHLIQLVGKAAKVVNRPWRGTDGEGYVFDIPVCDRESIAFGFGRAAEVALSSEGQDEGGEAGTGT